MNFQTLASPERLRPLIKSCWLVQNAAALPAQQTFRTVADGLPGLIFHRKADSESLRQFDKTLPAVFLYGQGTGYSEITTSGSLDLMGIYFQPHALRTIFGIDSAEITNSCIDLDDISRKYGFSISDQLFNANSTGDQTQIIHEFLFFLLENNGSKADDVAHYAVSKIAEKQGKMTVQELQQTLRLSERSLERKFLQQIGISPKLYLRIQRFQNALTQIRHKGFEKLTDVAYDHDYADQSHFLRDFKAFTGLAPSQYLKQTTEVLDNFSQMAV